MKAHIGVNTHYGQVYSLQFTPANVAEVTVNVQQLQGEETVVFANAGNIDAKKCAEPQHRSETWGIAMMSSTLTGIERGVC